MSNVKGLAVLVPSALLAEARELTALRFLDPAQREHFGVPASATGMAPATHHLSNWASAGTEFFQMLAAGSVMDPADYPDWIDTNLIAGAYAAYQVYDPEGLLQSVPAAFDAADVDLAKIVLIPTTTGKGGEVRTRLSELGVALVVSEPA